MPDSFFPKAFPSGVVLRAAVTDEGKEYFPA